MQEELEQYGSTYWHLFQQHPSVWICIKHDEFLMQSTGKSKIYNYLQWLLPHTLSRHDWRCVSKNFEKKFFLLKRFSEFAYELSVRDDLHFDSVALRYCYLAGVKNLGWLTQNGNVRMKATRQAFLDQTAGLAEEQEFSFIESARLKDFGFLGKLLRNPRSHLHPTKHILVKNFLFGSWDDFWTCYQEMNSDFIWTEIKSYNTQFNSKFEKLLSLTSRNEMPLSEIARTLDVPYDVARYWLRRAGIKYIRRDH
jgi:hypothetical protein